MKHIVFLKHFFAFVLLFFFFDYLISIALIHGLNKYFGFGNNPEVLLNGSSMSMSGFNREDIETLTKMKIATYTHEGVSVTDRYAMINHFFHMYPKGVKAVIYEVNPILFSNIKSAENVYTIFYPYMDDSAINKYIKEHASLKEYFINKIIRTIRFDSRLVRLIIMGYLGKYDNLKTNTLDTTELLPFIEQKGKVEVLFEKSNIEIFENTMDLIRSHNSEIVLVMMPMYYIKLQTFNSSDYERFFNYFKDYCSLREGVDFMDLNQDSITYNAGYFSDQLHFNINGQKMITNIISTKLIENSSEVEITQ
jgi:hypothetical protein